MAFLKNPRNLNAQTVQFRQIVAALAFWSRSRALAQRALRGHLLPPVRESSFAPKHNPRCMFSSLLIARTAASELPCPLFPACVTVTAILSIRGSPEMRAQVSHTNHAQTCQTFGAPLRKSGERCTSRHPIKAKSGIGSF